MLKTTIFPTQVRVERGFTLKNNGIKTQNKKIKKISRFLLKKSKKDGILIVSH